MASFKDLRRLANGFSLIAKETVKRNNLHNPDLQNLIRRAALSLTDLSGLTEGETRKFTGHKSNADSDNNNNRNSNSSVVYFENTPAIPNPEDTRSDQTDVLYNSGNVDGDERINRSGDGECETAVINPPVSIDRGDVTAVEEETAAPVTDLPVKTSVINPPVSTDRGDVTAVTAVEEETAAPVTDLPVKTPELMQKQRRRRERKVPSTPISRAIGFAGLGAGLVWGTVQESARRLVYGKGEGNQSALSPFLSESNAERLALHLCRMRGAALKLGQMLSIQDESLVPAPILAALDIVRQGADVMPRNQLNQVLDSELGTDWSSKLKSFDYNPLAAASIGQVHKAVTKDDIEVAMKIQYPGVANSIESDIENVKLLLDYTNLIPEGLYLDRAMKVAKEELSRECDYELESSNQKRFRKLLSNVDGFYVPFVVDELSSKKVITTEFVHGVPIDKVALLDQETRSYVGKKLLELTLMELYVFRFMQTDPNWSNFLYNEATRSVNLIDFGAARSYPKPFVDNYLRMVVACANCDREGVIEMSQRLGFLTGADTVTIAKFPFFVCYLCILSNIFE